MNIKIFSAVFFSILLTAVPVRAGETVKVKAAVLVASNDGIDSTPINDVYRRQLIQLFSYSAYSQTGETTFNLERSKRESVDLPDGYKLTLTLQTVENKRVQVQAVIRKDNVQYLDTVVSILRPGVVFLGGPPAQGGVLIIVLETKF